MNVADLMQWIALARRNPVTVLCAAICILCGCICWYIFGNMKWLEIERGQVTQDSDLALATMISGPSVRQERTAAMEVTRRIEQNLVVVDNLAENLWYFYKIEQQTKVRIAELRPENPILSDSKSPFMRVPFSIRVTGTYEQTAAFLYAIETGPRLAYIPSLMYRRVELETANPMVILEMNVQLLGKK
jgi:Tfp pilus assembly protein PilO